MIGGAFFSAAAFGLLIAAPIGPISLLCMNRTLSRGLAAGLATGCGIAAADAVYALAAAAGFRVFADAASGPAAGPLRAAGALFLGLLGWRNLRAALKAGDGSPGPAEERGRSLAAALLSACALTLSNPQTLLAFLALSAAIGSTGSPPLTAAGVLAGSLLWWTALSLLLHAVRRRFSRRAVRRLNAASSLLLLLLAAWALLTVPLS